jgi:hypothetical protein
MLPRGRKAPRGFTFDILMLMGISLNSILIGGGMVLAGVLLVRYTFKIVNMTGRQDWIEHFTGSGTTYGIYKILGVILVLLGFMVASGFGNDVLSWLLSPLHSTFHDLGS